MKPKRHETLAAVLLSGTFIFAGMSFAAGAADPVAIPDAPAATIEDPAVPPAAPAEAAAPGHEAVTDPAAKGASDAQGETIGAPAADAAAEPSVGDPSSEDAAKTAATPPEPPPAASANATVGDKAETNIAGLGQRSVDTSKMSRRQADRTEQKITQDLNRAVANSNTGTP